MKSEFKRTSDSVRSRAGSTEVQGGSIALAAERGLGDKLGVYCGQCVRVCVPMPVQYPACRLTNMWAPAPTNPPILFLSAHTMQILFVLLHILHQGKKKA